MPLKATSTAPNQGEWGRLVSEGIAKGIGVNSNIPTINAILFAMARPLRLEFAGALYHVTSRGDRREAIYLNNCDRQGWLDTD